LSHGQSLKTEDDLVGILITLDYLN
jgi:hypothetical protein